MAYNIEEILALPLKERRKISEEILNSLPENKSNLTLTEEERQLLDSRLENYRTGKSKIFTSEEMWEKVFKK